MVREARGFTGSHIRGGVEGFPFISLKFKSHVHELEGRRLPNTVQISASDRPSLARLRRLETDISRYMPYGYPIVETVVEKHGWHDVRTPGTGRPEFLLRHVIKGGGYDGDIIVRQPDLGTSAAKPRSPRETLDGYNV